MSEETILHDTWDMYYRMPKCNDWTIDGYSVIQKDIRTAEQCLYILNKLEIETIKGGMFYIMRNGISPIWECAENIQGGFFSFRIYDADTWRNAIYSMLGNTLFSDDRQMQCVNGISVTPKNGFMTLKLWLSGENILSLSNMVSIPGLDASSSTFRHHNIQTALQNTRVRPTKPQHNTNKQNDRRPTSRPPNKYKHL